MWLFQLSSVSYNKVSNYLIHLQKSANEISYKAAKQPHRNGHYTHSFEGHGERTAHYGFPFTAMPILHAYNGGAMCGCLARCLCEEGCEDRGCLYRSNPWTCTSKKVGFSLAWVQRMDLYEHLSNYSSSFQRTITFSGGFFKIRDSPRGSEYPKTAIFSLYLLHF